MLLSYRKHHMALLLNSFVFFFFVKKEAFCCTVSSPQEIKMPNKSILNENKCCNGVMGFNMIASCVRSSLLPLIKTYEVERGGSVKHCLQWTGPVQANQVMNLKQRS